MSGAVAILQIAKMMFAGNTTLEAETVVFNIHRYYYSNGQFLPEGAHSDLRALCKTALSGFKDLLSEKEIETILDKYCPEGAYHGVRNMQPLPRVMRLEGKDRRDHDRAGFRRRSLTTHKVTHIHVNWGTHTRTTICTNTHNHFHEHPRPRHPQLS